MICFILAGGYATRLYPLTKNEPKALLPVKGKSIMGYLLEDLQTIPEIKKIVIVSNEKFKGNFECWVKEHTINCPVEVYSNGSKCPEDSPGAVGCIVTLMEDYKVQEDVMIVASDNLLDFSLKTFVDIQKEKGGSWVMWHAEMEEKRLQKTGVAQIEGERILRMEEKPEKPFATCAIPPFYIYSRDVVDEITAAVQNGCKKDSPGNLLEWLSKRHTIHAMEMPGKRYDIGSLENYYKIQEIWRENENNNA